MPCEPAPSFSFPLQLGGVAPQGGFLTDLTEINLLGWAALVQDVVAGLQVLPPRLSHGLGSQVVALLQLLEVATGAGFCCYCCNLEPHCRCVGVPQLTPPTSWSQFMEQTQGYGVAPSSGGVPTLSTSRGGMPGYMPPLPGISIWNMPPFEDAIPPGPVTISPYQDVMPPGPVTIPLYQDVMPPGSVTIPLYQPPTGRAGWLRVHDEQEGYSATDSSDAYTHPSATFTLPELTSNPISAASAAAE